MARTVSLRAAGPGDGDFLHRVYASTRETELARLDWDRDQRAAFVAGQFEAQHAHYGDRFPDACHSVVEVGGVPVGRLIVDHLPVETRVLDISLLPEARGKGVGTSLLRSVIADADARGVPVRVHVERENPALGWYRRLGFVVAEDRGVYLFLCRHPAEAPRPAPVSAWR